MSCRCNSPEDCCRQINQMLALPIFPGSHPPSIVGANELNFCVRDGNRWILAAINTNSCRGYSPLYVKGFIPMTSGLYHSYKAMSRAYCLKSGDPYRIRTDVKGVRGLCLNHLTNGPFGAPSGTRTRDPLIKSQVLYQLS